MLSTSASRICAVRSVRVEGGECRLDGESRGAADPVLAVDESRIEKRCSPTERFPANRTPPSASPIASEHGRAAPHASTTEGALASSVVLPDRRRMPPPSAKKYGPLEVDSEDGNRGRAGGGGEEP